MKDSEVMDGVVNLSAVVLGAATALAALGPIAIEQVKSNKVNFRQSARLYKRTRLAIGLLIPAILVSALVLIVSLVVQISPFMIPVAKGLVIIALASLVVSSMIFIHAIYATVAE